MVGIIRSNVGMPEGNAKKGVKLARIRDMEGIGSDGGVDGSLNLIKPVDRRRRG